MLLLNWFSKKIEYSTVDSRGFILNNPTEELNYKLFGLTVISEAFIYGTPKEVQDGKSKNSRQKTMCY